MEAEVAASGRTMPEQRRDSDNGGRKNDGWPCPAVRARQRSRGYLRFLISAWFADDRTSILCVAGLPQSRAEGDGLLSTGLRISRSMLMGCMAFARAIVRLLTEGLQA